MDLFGEIGYVYFTQAFMHTRVGCSLKRTGKILELLEKEKFITRSRPDRKESPQIVLSYEFLKEACKSTFIRLPWRFVEGPEKMLVGLEPFDKLLYAVLVDKFIKDPQVGENGKFFVEYTLDQMMTAPRCARATAVGAIKRLVEQNLQRLGP